MPALDVAANGFVETWTIMGEARRNAISRAMVDEFVGHLARLSATRDVRAIVLTGQGDKAFCAGADLKERMEMSEDEVRTFLGKLKSILQGIERTDVIVIAYLNGIAFGGGTELALCCDLRVAAPHAELGLTEVKLGIIPGGGGTQRLPRLVGPGRARELIYTGRRVGAKEAYDIGLVERIGTLADAQSLAAEIAANAPIALGAAKQAMRRGAHLALEDALQIEFEEYQKTLGTADRLEGLAAFAEKRAPRFAGK